MKKYVGKSRIENLDWLVNVWLKDGPPVCFLQGFAGVGKTDLARDFRELAEREQLPDKKPKWQQAVINEISDRATPSVLESLMELSITLSQQGLTEMEKVIFEQKDANLGFALEKALRRPVVIVLDEAQRFFRDDTGAPLPEMNGILSFLRNRPNLPGRLLLLSDRIVEESRWSEWIPKRTLTKLEPKEAVEALDTRLVEAGLSIEIAAARKNEIVRDLDFNPRAIEALVGALRYESLDDIIQSNPGLWAVHDREVSRDFLRALERDLLERTLRHLGEVYQQKLWLLAVHRRSFRREALERLCSSKDEANELRFILLGRYLLNFYKGLLSLNPIVREISLAHLRDDPAEFKRAHSGAADYHLRHFTAKQMVGSQTKLGASFAELRYHLVQARREAELAVIGHRFTDHLKQEIKSVSPVPTNHEELDERIGVLTVLLETGGAKGLEYYLARCLGRRSDPGDIEQAIIHARRAIDRGIADPWVLCADLLSKAGKTDDAVALLKDGIKVIPADKNLFSLYQVLGEVFCRAGKLTEAIDAQREGFRQIPAQFNGYKLAEGALYLCAAADESKTLAEILAGTGADAVGPQQAALGSVLQCLIRGDWQSAADNAKAARREFPRYFGLTIMESFSHLAAGDVEAAWQALFSFPKFTFSAGDPAGWLTALINLRRGLRAEAAAVLATYLGRPVDESRELSEPFLLRLWDQQDVSPESSRLCFYFPIMPASLTGLSHTVRRVPFGKPVLPLQSATSKDGTIIPSLNAPAPPATTEVYVSYSWGEDTTEAGRQREQIVDRLCSTVTASGQAIGRDKERMRGGDSIERFAHEISKARRIIAVISEKSLHSEFCMAHELFRAFRRCDYQRAEFQEKVIGLVMDDAKPYLKDHLTVVALAKEWQERLVKLRTELLSLDPNRKSPNLWVFVDMMEDMCPRLPDMLNALRDIVMKRGFDEIVENKFAEVLSRLSSSNAL